MRQIKAAIDFDHWARHGQQGTSVVYHQGHIAVDRTKSAKVDRLAHQAALEGENDFPLMTPCGHLKAYIQARRRCRLTQERNGKGCWMYIATKI